MKILNTLNNEDVTTTEKLNAVNIMVLNVRTTYGNLDVDIDPIKVATTDGWVPISLLDDKEKVAVATVRIKAAVAGATVVTEETQGTKFDRLFEAQVAVDPILCNLDAKSDSAY